MSKSTKEICLCGIMCALGVALMCLGTVIPITVYACPVLASLTMIPVREQCRKSYGWCCFAATAILCILLTPDKEAAMLFCVLGYYPLIHPGLNRIKPKAVQAIIKLAIFSAAICIMYAVLMFVFRLSTVIAEFQTTGKILMIATLVLGVAVFFIYDRLLDVLTVVYIKRLRKRG